MRRLVCKLLGHDRWVTLDGWEGVGTPLIYRDQCARCCQRLKQRPRNVIHTYPLGGSGLIVEIVEYAR